MRSYTPLGYAALAGLAAATPFPAASVNTGTRYLFITGDSLTATGFNASLQPQPSLQNPLGNPAYPGATFSGGENWVDIVVYNSSSVTKTTPIAYNYAVGGNTVNISRTQIVPSNAPSPIADLIQQVAEFSALAKKQGPYPPPAWTSENSLFIQWFGTNDIFFNGLYTSRNFTEAQPYLVGDVGDFYKQLDILYHLGARQFLTILIHPVWRAPVLVSNPEKVAQAKNLTAFWNSHIQSRNAAFLRAHPGASSSFFDPSPTFNRILDDPAAYGAPNNTCESFPAGQPCLWYDYIHPGIVMQRSLGRAIAGKIRDIGFF